MIDTTQMFPRKMGYGHPEQVAIFGPYTPQKKSSGQVEFWICIALAFVCGIVFKSIWG